MSEMKTLKFPGDADPREIVDAKAREDISKLFNTLSNSMTAYRTAAAQDVIDSGKVDKVTGKGLSTNDYTASAKAKVDAIPANPKYTDTVYDDTALKERVATIEGKESAWDAKLNASELPTAINTALAQAKASGEFDGADGSPGKDGAPGKDGHSPVVTATKSGKTTTISVDGTAIATVEDGADGGGGGGSADAVLYTAQTLTDAQKKQARDNIDAAIADFIVNGTINSDNTVTLDKTIAQIQAAIQEGKHPVAHITEDGYDSILPLVGYATNGVAFAAVADVVSEGNITCIGIAITADGDILYDQSTSPALNSDGALIQYPMVADPIFPMEIATKQYVDNKECILKSTTPGSTKKFKITVDDSGTLKATEVT